MPAATPSYSPRTVRKAVGFVVAAVAVEFAHRQILALAVEPLRRELGLSDTELGSLLTAFACAYAVCALGLGRLADAADRRLLFAACIAFWSAATAATAGVASHAALLATRAAVGAGQAGSGACATPLVVDYVAPERRATTLGLLAMGGTLGTFVALLAGGPVVQSLGWRWLFAGSGALGLAFAIAFAALVDEPPRGWSEGRAHEAGVRPPLGQVLRTLAGIRALRHLVAGTVLASAGLMAGAQWGPAFLERAHGFSSAQAGAASGLAALVGSLGAVAGGVLADRLWSRRPGAALLVPAASSAAAFPLAALAFTSASASHAVALICASVALQVVYSAPTGAIAQVLVPLRMRAVTAGALSALVTLVGLGLGPLVAGWLSDRLAAAGGLGTALAVVSALHLWAALHFALAARAVDPPALAVAPPAAPLETGPAVGSG